MSKDMTETGKSPSNKEQKLLETKESYEKMRRTIAPYLRLRKFTRSTTAGEWCKSLDGTTESQST